MSELIKREDAIGALRREYPTMPMFKSLREEWAIKTEGFRKAEEVIMSIPSAETEIEIIRAKAYAKGIDSERKRISDWCRPQGEWIKHDEERDYCSRCKHIFKTRTITQQDKWTQYIDDLGYNYCPNCGARMKGADDYERAVEQMEHDALYEPTYNPEDGSM